MSIRPDVFGKAMALDGDHTTTGAICIATLLSSLCHGKKILRVGDPTTRCPKCHQLGSVVTGENQVNNFGKAQAVHGSIIQCGCPFGTNRVIAVTPSSYGQTLAINVANTQVSNQTRPYNKAPNSAHPIAYVVTEAPPAPLLLPALIYQTKRLMDDYQAQDMRYGDYDALTLKERFNLDVKEISTKVNPLTNELKQPFNESLFLSSEDALGLPESSNIKVTRAETVTLLFDEFRKVAKMFSFHGEYQHVMTEMITHMQENSGTPFKSPYLDKALKEQILGDQSDKSSLLAIKGALKNTIDFQYKAILSKNYSKFEKAINKTILPKFNTLLDRTNGLVITVHDTWSTHITLEWLEVSNDTYQARIHYRVQDHFGLDDADILNPLYRQARVFRLWFVLQHWNEYGYRPFITEMNATVEIQGRRDE